jgi:hypothetical protein
VELEKSPIKIGYVAKKQILLFYSLIIPFMFTFAGLIIFIKIENTNLFGLRYLGMFFLGGILTSIGLIWTIVIIAVSMKKTWQEDKILKNTKEGMKNPLIKSFYWIYAVACLVGLLIAIWKDNENYIDYAGTFVIIGGILIWIFQRIKARK